MRDAGNELRSKRRLCRPTLPPLAASLPSHLLDALHMAQLANPTHPTPLCKYTHRSKEEIQQFEQFAKQDGLHEELFARIAPNIYGSDDIKKAVACLLFGGARKVCGEEGTGAASRTQ